MLTWPLLPVVGALAVGIGYTAAMELALTDEQKADVERAVKRYFAEELDQDIGDLKAQLFAEFIYEHIAPIIYARAIHDAHVHLQEKLLDMEAILQLGGRKSARRR